MKSNFLYLTCVILISSSCVTKKPFSLIAPLTNPNVAFNLYYDADQNIPPLDSSVKPDESYKDNVRKIYTGGDAKNYFIGKSRIEVEDLSKTDQLKIKVEISKGKNSDGEYDDFDISDTYTNIYSSSKYIYSITKKSLLNKGTNLSLSNNHYLKITAYDGVNGSSADPLMQAVFLTKIKWQPLWKISFEDIFFTPVLFRVTGNAGGFNLGSITPSVGMRLIKLNTNAYTFDNINLSGFLSITNYSNSSDVESYQYSMSAGGFVDLSGIFQLGCGYSFKESKSYAIIGFSSDIFSKLFGNE